MINSGIFGSWIQMDTPPLGVKRIVNASKAELWFETRDGKLYHSWFGYGQFAEFHWYWSPPLDDISEIPELENPLVRGTDCTKLRSASFVRSPQAKIVECIYAESPDSDSGSYYALTSDGNVLLWREADGMISLLISICNISLTLAATISIIYFIVYIATRTKHAPKGEDSAPFAGIFHTTPYLFLFSKWTASRVPAAAEAGTLKESNISRQVV